MVVFCLFVSFLLVEFFLCLVDIFFVGFSMVE